MSRLKILVPVDFSPSSHTAAAWAYDYAQLVDAEIHLLHVIDRPWRLDDLHVQRDRVLVEIDNVFRSAKAELASMAADARERVGAVFEHVSMGHPEQEILEMADRLGAALMVMGTHGYTGLERVLIGSVAEAMVRRAPCTVVTVKA